MPASPVPTVFTAPVSDSSSYPLYLLQGVAYNNTSNFNKALESLEFGIDYIIEDAQMQADMFTQMSEAYKGMGNNAKATEFLNRATQAKKQAN